MKLGILFSGGKDSLYATYLAGKKNEIACLITVISGNKESYMFHTPNINLVDIQAEALDLPLVKIKSEGEKEKELEDLKTAIKTAIKKYGIEGIVTGAVASNYQASRVKEICNKLGMKCISPLWHKNQSELLNEIIQHGFKVIIVGVAAYPLDEKWLGREIDGKCIDELKQLEWKLKINPAGEGGEIETFVLDSPMHRKRIEIVDAEKNYKDYNGVFEIKKARMLEK